MRGRREYLEDPQRLLKLAQRGSQDGTDPETPAADQVYLGVALGVIAEDDFTSPETFGRNARLGLKTHSKVGSSASGAGTANDFVSLSQCDCGAGSSSESLGALCDYPDSGLEINLWGSKMPVVRFFGFCLDYPSMMARRKVSINRRSLRLRLLRRKSSQQLADKPVQFVIFN